MLEFRHKRSRGKCPTSLKLVGVFLSRPQPEASTSLKLVGQCAARFSFFQGVATRHAELLKKSTTKERRARKLFLAISSSPSFLRGRFSFYIIDYWPFRKATGFNVWPSIV